jgi:hypothetical protein
MRDADIIALTIIIGAILIAILLILPIAIESVKLVINGLQNLPFGIPITYIILGTILVIGAVLLLKILAFLSNIINEVMFLKEKKRKSTFVVFVSISTPEIFTPDRNIKFILNKVKGDINLIALPAPKEELFGKPKDKILYKKRTRQFGNTRMIIFPISSLSECLKVKNK